MDRGAASNLLAARLNDLRSEGYDALLQRVDQPTSAEDVHLCGETVTVGIDISWADRSHRQLRVSATALGPSTWDMERLDESFVIGPGGTAKG